jgi:Co/Zn/Cd efflux system component
VSRLPTAEHTGHGHDHGHGHSHGLIDPAITRSRDGLRVVGISLAVLALTAAAQAAIYVATGSVALLADLIHNAGDAMTAIPLGAAFLLRSLKAEKRAGYFVVATIFVSACVALWQSIERLIGPEPLRDLGVLAAAGIIGFLGNEAAAWVRLHGGRRLNSPPLIADGYHARTDGLVSLAVVLSAIVVALGAPIGDPVIGLVVTLVILRITWQSVQTVRADPGTAHEHDARGGPPARHTKPRHPRRSGNSPGDAPHRTRIASSIAWPARPAAGAHSRPARGRRDRSRAAHSPEAAVSPATIAIAAV